MANGRLMKLREACSLAGLHKDRVNEALHAGLLTFLPPTTPGKTRMVNERCVEGLRIYAARQRMGWNSKAASDYAAEKLECRA